MDQIRDYADNRLFRGCAYCGGVPDTRDHVPSCILLDEPFPEQLPIVGACKACNGGFSIDEQYVACLVECARLGHVDPSRLERAKVAKILRRSPALRSRLEAARSADGDQIMFAVESERIRNVLLKLAKGHAMFELSWFAEHDPASCWWAPIHLLDEVSRATFEGVSSPVLFGEIGSRAYQRMMVMQMALRGPDGEERVASFPINDWIDVQEGRYRYIATDQDGVVRVRIVIGEYLACEFVWELT